MRSCTIRIPVTKQIDVSTKFLGTRQTTGTDCLGLGVRAMFLSFSRTESEIRAQRSRLRYPLVDFRRESHSFVADPLAANETVSFPPRRVGLGSGSARSYCTNVGTKLVQYTLRAAPASALSLGNSYCRV